MNRRKPIRFYLWSSSNWLDDALATACWWMLKLMALGSLLAFVGVPLLLLVGVIH